MSIKNRIKSILVEMNLDQLYGDLKSARAKASNLVHVGYGNWKNPARESFKWDDSQKIFVKIKSDEEKDTKPKKDTSELQVGDRIKLVGDTSVLKGNEYFSVNGVAEEGNDKPILGGEKGYQLRSSDNSKPLLLMWVKAKNDPRFEIEYVGPKKMYDKDGKWINKDPDPAEQKIKNQIKSKLEEPEEDYEIEKTGEEYGDKKMVSKNWAISYSTRGRYNTFEIYGDIQNIGKRGKMVKNASFTIQYPSMGRYAWASNIEDEILKAKPKTFEALIDFIDKQTEIAKNTESGVRIYKNPVKEVKGIYSHIPDFGLEGDYENVQGADVGIKFSKPDIKIDSSMDSKEADKSHMRRFIEIKWNQAKKVNAIKDQLKSVVGLNNVARVLTNNKIKFKTHSHMDGMYN